MTTSLSRRYTAVDCYTTSARCIFSCNLIEIPQERLHHPQPVVLFTQFGKAFIAVFDKILVPLDGSALATCVLPHVAAMAHALGSNLTLLRVLEGYDSPGGAVNPVDWQLHKAEAQSYLKALSSGGDEQMDRPPTLQMLEGPAAQGIIEYAQKNEFDLVALSSHGHGGLNGWNVGSVVQKVIDRVRKSILLVRAYEPPAAYAEDNWGAFRYRRILVPLDGSQRAEFVLPVVTALARYYEAEVLLVHVVARPEMIWRMPLTAEDSRLLAELMERNRAQVVQSFTGLQARLPLVSQLDIQLSANVAATLYDLVEQADADLVVLSAHGHSGLPQWPYGSIASSFLTNGTTPLLIMQDLQPHEIPLSKAERMGNVAQLHPYATHRNFEAEGLKSYLAG
jgi:nucleotide-binding universal stress UspA family protein